MSGGPAVPVEEMSGMPGQARHDDVSDGRLGPVVEAVNSPGLSGRMSGCDQRRPQNPHPPLAGEVAGQRPDGGVSRHREGDTPPSRAPRATPPLPGEDG